MDFIFSYWIFFWWILYEFNIIKYNPKIIFSFAIIENVFLLLLKIKNENYCSIPSFIIINFFIKIIPIIMMWNTQINIKDLIFGIVLLIIYILWLYFNNKLNFNIIIKSLIEKKYEVKAPFEYFFNKMFNIEC